jgi:hypothetical protein
MASYEDNLKAVKENIAARLAEITASPKPSYSIDGQSVSWTEYFNSLVQQLKEINQQLEAAGSVAVAPWEIRQRGI